MGNKAAIALFGMSGILVLFAAYASFLPDVLESKAQVEINTTRTEIVNHLNKAGDWEEWLFENEVKDKGEWRTVTSGKSSGEGSVLKWFSKIIGDGGLEIKKLDSTQIVFERISDNGSFEDRCYLNLESTENGVLIKMVDSLGIKSNFIARYEAQDEDYIKVIDSNNKKLLERLKAQIETGK